MITASWPRLVIGTILLFVGAAEGYLAWAWENCVDSVANSLIVPALVTLAINVLAWLLLGRRVPSKLVLFVAVLPTLAAMSYTVTTAQITLGYLRGTSVCATITGNVHDFTGRDLIGIVLWLLVCLSFWVGLFPVVRRAISVWKERHE